MKQRLSYIEIFSKKLSDRFFKVDERKVKLPGSAITDIEILPGNNLKENQDEWKQEYEIIYSSYILEK